MAMLEVKNLGISFGGLRAVDDFNLSIEQGQLYGLIGPNGAGKTTVFNMLTVSISQRMERFSWTVRISPERAPLRSTKKVLREHSRISVCSRICPCSIM